MLVPPLTASRRVSIKVHNFETNELKVNDLDGNPVNIAAIVVWQVADTARAVFAVEAYEEFIKAQAESALRHVATTHPYDEPGPGETSLRGGTDVVSAARSTTLDAASRPPPCAGGVGRVRTVGRVAVRTAPPSRPTLSTRPRTVSRRGGPLPPGLDGPARSAPHSGWAGPALTRGATAPAHAEAAPAWPP